MRQDSGSVRGNSASAINPRTIVSRVCNAFNPASLSRDNPVAGLHTGGSFRDVCAALVQSSKQSSKRGCSMYQLINPVVGPEAVAGSSRMKGGTTTLILADAICYRATQLSKGMPAPSIEAALGRAHEAMRATYKQARDIAKVLRESLIRPQSIDVRN